MKRLLQLGFLLGLAGTIAAAYLTPFVDYTRYRSAATVVANGGRVEQFMVRLPADRIGQPVAAPSPAAADGGSMPRLEHFKLRDADGNVIGLAARHELVIADRIETAWLLTIPSRGAIVLAAASPASASIDAVLAERGLVPGEGAAPELSIDLGEPAASVAATGEFSELDFELVETWIVTGLDADGGIQGTLRLNTVGRQS